MFSNKRKEFMSREFSVPEPEDSPIIDLTTPDSSKSNLSTLNSEFEESMSIVTISSTKTTSIGDTGSIMSIGSSSSAKFTDDEDAPFTDHTDNSNVSEESDGPVYWDPCLEYPKGDDYYNKAVAQNVFRNETWVKKASERERERDMKMAEKWLQESTEDTTGVFISNFTI